MMTKICMMLWRIASFNFQPYYRLQMVTRVAKDLCQTLKKVKASVVNWVKKRRKVRRKAAGRRLGIPH